MLSSERDSALFCKLDRDGGLGRDLLGVGHGFLHEPLVGDRASNKAHCQCTLGIDGTAGEHHVHCGLEPDSTRQRIAETHLGHQPDAHECARERGALGCEPDVMEHGQCQAAAAGRRTIHRCDQWLVEIL